MIKLLGLSRINGDALTQLGIDKFDDPYHTYYTIGIRADVSEVIQDYNVACVTVHGDVVVISGNTETWRWLIHKLRASGEKKQSILADAIDAYLPHVFRAQLK